MLAVTTSGLYVRVYNTRSRYEIGGNAIRGSDTSHLCLLLSTLASHLKKNGTPASPAIAFASKVFPVPGGPVSSTPFGSFPPKRVNRPGSFRNSTISETSFLASSQPRTSANVFTDFSGIASYTSDVLLSRSTRTQRSLTKFRSLHPRLLSAVCCNQTLDRLLLVALTKFIGPEMMDTVM